jgi:nucleoside-diphosphate-sugar epimerase
MQIIVTGSRGTLGVGVVAVLREAGHRVIEFDTRVERGPDAVQIDMTDYGQVADAIAGVEERHDGVDAVVHLAAVPAPGIVPDTVLLTQNLTMTINVFQAARRAGVKRIVHASSETLLGIPMAIDPPYAPLDEAADTRPEFMYAVGKHLEEELAKKLVRWDPHLRITGLRFSNVMTEEDYAEFSTWQNDTSLRRWNLFGYIDRRDGGQAVLRALENAAPGYDTFIIAAADTVMERDSADLLAAEFPTVPLAREVVVREALLDITRARELLGYAPQYSWRDHAST